MPENYDVIVVGLGAMGSASVFQLAKRNAKVLGLEQFHASHVGEILAQMALGENHLDISKFRFDR